MQALPQGTTIPSTWSSVSTADQVGDDWLRSFNDPRIDALVEEAITHNLDLRQAAASVEIARQNVVVVGSQLLPQIGAKLGAVTTRDLDEDTWFNSTLAQRLRIVEREIENRALSVSISRIKYKAGTMDLLSVLQLEEGLLNNRAQLIQLRTALLANRINLHLALGGSFDAAPASAAASLKPLGRSAEIEFQP